jgi:hypothetical protein
MEKCVICHKSTRLDRPLSNGTFFHSFCQKELDLTIENYSQEERNLLNEIAQIDHKIVSYTTITFKVFSFFNLQEDDSESLKEEIHTLRERYAVVLGKKNQQELLRGHIYDYMVDYPPDWEARRRKILGRCYECGTTTNLQVHHVTPLSKGGSNRLENLQCLCVSCHSHRHGGRDLTNPAQSTRKLAIDDRLVLINKAIETNSVIEFQYAKPGEPFQKRECKPKKLVNYPHIRDDGNTLCVSGYCCLRKAERSFAIKRMKDINIKR